VASLNEKLSGSASYRPHVDTASNKMNLQFIAVQACYRNPPKQVITRDKRLHSAQRKINHNN